MGIVEQRGQQYGDPRPNHERIAALWAAYLGHPITAHDVAICMVLVKASRAKAGRNPDNYTDMAGYAEIAGELA